MQRILSLTHSSEAPLAGTGGRSDESSQMASVYELERAPQAPDSGID